MVEWGLETMAELGVEMMRTLCQPATDPPCCKISKTQDPCAGGRGFVPGKETGAVCGRASGKRPVRNHGNAANSGSRKQAGWFSEQICTLLFFLCIFFPVLVMAGFFSTKACLGRVVHTEPRSHRRVPLPEAPTPTFCHACLRFLSTVRSKFTLPFIDPLYRPMFGFFYFCVRRVTTSARTSY